MQFSVIAEIESMKLPFSFIKTDDETMKRTNGVSSMNEALDNVLDQVFEQHPLRIELYEAAYMRAQQSKKFMKNYFAANSHLLTDKSHKVGIVSHGMNVRCLSASGFDVEKKKLVGAEDMKNCQIHPCKNYQF